MHVWDTSTNPSVRKAFAQRVPEPKDGAEDRLIGVDDDDSSSSDEEEDGGVEAAAGQDEDDSMDED